MSTRIITAIVALAIGVIAGLATLRPTAAPEVRFATLAGEKLSTSDLRGKVVLVNFWATWCTNCLQEMPKMVETYRRFAPRGYDTVAVAVQSHPNQVAEYAASRRLPFKVVLDASGEVARSFGDVRITPTSVLIDRQGRIVRQFVGEPDWGDLYATLEKLLDS